MRLMELASQGLAAAGGAVSASFVIALVRALPCEAAGHAPASTIRAEKSHAFLSKPITGSRAHMQPACRHTTGSSRIISPHKPD